MSNSAQTFIHKNIRGNWTAETNVPFTPAKDGKERVIRLYTSKGSSGALYTSATVQTLDGKFMSFVMFQDYSKTVEQERVRCTDKNVEAQHARALARIEEIKAAATEHYTK